ncbi:hypothetical protein [Microbacterium trichothecenolyticum]|uniref:Lipoprotein n=1 Tax=Microbacterium trichothecenolyticum TaxID=69370 RepID=A0ABU0TVG4_MICTR|nr:hypothetical protein [Microbacterium trichothecenolyticum]MDQ1123495.1 hypothetical protein [Microbacterium trichothecenolyticum]
MSRRTLSFAGVVGAALLTAGALAGCATGASSPSSSTGPSSSTPDATGVAPATQIGAAWLDGGRSIAVVTSGSSSCPPVVSGEPTLADGTVSVTLAESPRDNCTRDMAPRATLVGLPSGTDVARAWTVSVEGVAEGRAMLDGLTSAAPTGQADFSPSAGWVDDSLIAILTYGSSGCPPTVESVTTAGSDIAVQFATPPADQVCTMDIAPRVTLAEVGGDVPAGEVSLTLSGGNVDATGPITVLGTR